jgi:hypothetical protein
MEGAAVKFFGRAPLSKCAKGSGSPLYSSHGSFGFAQDRAAGCRCDPSRADARTKISDFSRSVVLYPQSVDRFFDKNDRQRG